MPDERPTRDAFARWASRQPAVPRDPDSLIDTVETTSEFVGILGTDVQGRRVVWKSIPADSRARVSFPSITIENIDPWSVEAAPLRAASNHVALCHSCNGERKTTCDSCGGSGKMLCGACNGQRKMYGYASNGSRRLLNCTNCRGKGNVDCGQCRRGITSCPTCEGSGRLQRWIELEWWRRFITQAHPAPRAQQLSWEAYPSNEGLERDAEISAAIERPYRLTASDLDGVPAKWLDVLAPSLQPGERVARQQLRIARVPVTTVTYHLGRASDQVAFTGRRFAAPVGPTANAFTRRAAKLGSLRWLLLTIGVVTVLVILGRGTFYWSLATLFSLIAFGGTLACLYTAIAEWTAANRRTLRWLIASAILLATGGALTIVALPRLRDVQRLIAAGKLNAAEAELAALGADGTQATWADLRLARVRHAPDVEAARATLALIPKEVPQHDQAMDALDALILRDPSHDTLALLSSRARGAPATIRAAEAVYLPLAQEHLGRDDWSAAANAIVAARELGVPPPRLELLTSALHDAAADAVDAATRQKDAGQRLHARRTAEAILIAWERAANRWGSPELIELRTAMARDVAAAERAAGRRRAS